MFTKEDLSKIELPITPQEAHNLYTTLRSATRKINKQLNRSKTKEVYELLNFFINKEFARGSIKLHKDKTPQEKGAQAYQSGQTGCPFPEGSNDAKLWHSGRMHEAYKNQ